jgi:DNA (cytosine-5)-methyltransferase 1
MTDRGEGNVLGASGSIFPTSANLIVEVAGGTSMRDYRPTALEIFSGAGGMTLGFEQAGLDVLAAFDLEEVNVATHQANFPGTKAFPVDLSIQTGDSLRSLAKLNKVEIDVVFGGPPCSGFSFGGHQNVDDERNQLVFDFARLVRQLEPKYFVMENVKGLMSAHNRPILDSLVRRVKRAGYRIVEPIRVLNAAHYGVPQRRWRTFVLGYRNDMPPLEYPEPRGWRDASGNEFYPLVRDAISDLPSLEEHENLFASDTFAGYLDPPDNAYASLMRGKLLDKEDKSDRQQPNRNGLTGCFRTKHSKEIIHRFSRTAQGAAEPVSRYIRLAWNDVSPTIRAGTGSDHGSHTAPRPIHPKMPRCISAREAARLHSIPDWFCFHGTRWHDFRQIGNSVPPLLARAVAKNVVKALNS